ncbi:MAG: transposase [Flavobacteriales bacterium]
MSDKYKAVDDDNAHFVTITVVDWIDLFTRNSLRNVVIDSLKYCREHKGLEIYGWCLMSSHLHMICKAAEGYKLSDIIRDFKTHTSKKIIETIINKPESRREWLLEAFSKACEHLKRDQKFKVWQNGYHAEEIRTNAFLTSKLDYIHQNPVKDGLVESPEDYMFSSARNYSERSSLLEIDVVSRQWKTIT